MHSTDNFTGNTPTTKPATKDSEDSVGIVITTGAGDVRSSMSMVGQGIEDMAHLASDGDITMAHDEDEPTVAGTPRFTKMEEEKDVACSEGDTSKSPSAPTTASETSSGKTPPMSAAGLGDINSYDNSSSDSPPLVQPKASTLDMYPTFCPLRMATLISTLMVVWWLAQCLSLWLSTARFPAVEVTDKAPDDVPVSRSKKRRTKKKAKRQRNKKGGKAASSENLGQSDAATDQSSKGGNGPETPRTTKPLLGSYQR